MCQGLLLSCAAVFGCGPHKAAAARRQDNSHTCSSSSSSIVVAALDSAAGWHSSQQCTFCSCCRWGARSCPLHIVFVSLLQTVLFTAGVTTTTVCMRLSVCFPMTVCLSVCLGVLLWRVRTKGVTCLLHQHLALQQRVSIHQPSSSLSYGCVCMGVFVVCEQSVMSPSHVTAVPCFCMQGVVELPGGSSKCMGSHSR